MARGSRAWKAGAPIGSVGFRLPVNPDVPQEAPEDFIEHQAQAWHEVRQWSDDQMGIVETEPGGSPNGPGASLDLTVGLREELPKLLKRYGIRSVLDVACGDWNWMRHVDLDSSGIRVYYGWDVDAELIRRCQQRAAETRRQRRFPDRPNGPPAWFAVRNIADTTFPGVGVILARQILIHFPNDYIAWIIDKMRGGGSNYLLTDNFPSVTNDFVYDPSQYAWMGYMERPVNLDIAPFGLGECKVDAIEEQTGPGGVLAIPHELALYRLRGV